MRTMQTADGLALAYEVKGSGPLAVILQHGWASTGRHFDHVLAHLSNDGRTYVTLDLAGHGASGNRSDAHSVAAYAQQLLQIADHLGLARFVTVGHSMGAKFNQYLRLLAPGRLLGQVAVAPSPAGLVQEEASDDVINHLAGCSGNPEAMAGVLRSLMTVPVSDALVAGWSESAARIPSEVLAASMRAFARTDFEPELIASASVLPTLVIGGAHDPIYKPLPLTERIKRETPSATIRILDCGHDVPSELPYETALLLDGFLAAIDPRR